MNLNEALNILNNNNYITEARPHPYRQPITQRNFNQKETDLHAKETLRYNAYSKINKNKVNTNAIIDKVTYDLWEKYVKDYLVNQAKK